MMSLFSLPKVTVARPRVEGALVALAAGDALGWPQEFLGRKNKVKATPAFRDWDRRRGGRFQPHTETIRAGEYSDDTQLTLAVARSRVSAGNSWWAHFTRNELPLWTLYERGGGGATKRAAASWLRGVPPWKQSDSIGVARYFEAGGNGVAMRVIPHAIFHAEADDPASMLRDVLLDGTATHGHPRALVGAAVYSFAAWWLLRTQHTVGFGELLQLLLKNSAVWGAMPSSTKTEWFDAANKSLRGYEELWADVVGETCQLLRDAEKGLEQGVLADDADVLNQIGAYGKEKGSGTISAVAAIYLASRHAVQPLQGVLRAAFALGSDTDTIAAMTGGLLGALAGSDWLPPEWGEVQDLQYIKEIANRLASKAQPDFSVVEHPPVTAKLLDNIMTRLVDGQLEIDFGGARRARVNGRYNPVPATNSIDVVGWQLLTSDLQTVHIVRVTKTPPSERPNISDPGSPKTLVEERLSEERLEARAGGIKLSVNDLVASTIFYEALGLQADKKTLRFVTFGAISLVDANTAVELSRGDVTGDFPTRRNRVELHVNDIALARFMAAKAGANPDALIESSWGEVSFHVLDPDKNLVEVIEKRASKDTSWGRSAK